MNLEKLSDILKNEPKFRYAQINKALWQEYISSWEEASNLPKVLRETLAADCPLEIKAEVFKSSGGLKSLKALITLADGETIETVLIRQKEARNTVCVSSQAGCPLGCAFCATGMNGFSRNLMAEEIVEQVLFWARYLKTEGRGEKIDNLVFMGMGEPFLNYVEFIKAVKFLNNPETFNIGARRLSVSTVGITEGIKRLAGEQLQINLAISLHAAFDNLRQSLIPVAKKYPLHEIFRAVDNYITKTGRRVMFEYLMIKGVNDTDKDALELVKLMKKPLYLVNLIPYNATGKFKSSDRERIDAFKKILEDNGVPATVRLSFGSSIDAACGQLKGKRNK
ncbi:MAG: 23S rRNA (adenine(2503)-C(2))-methyltransferase RlmN [Candidatus Falkowbacteria bacterium]|nr:23S rRNA (adenine(2503)-C(2))-methyltransferase RlmN [Candidatus Falkowbacteria bacterium]